MTSAAASNRRPSPEEAATRVGGLFERHARMVYGVCRAMLRDLHDAEDATQQVFLSAHSALLSGTDVRDSGAWLATIARNECRGRIATGMRRPLPVADEDLDAIPSRLDDQERRAQVDELREALAALPDRQREAAVLRYLYGLRYGEVATALGLSRPATEALLFRARRALQGTLRPVAGAALAVPLAVRDELALALPGFSADVGRSAAAAGVAGGLLAKLTAGPVGMKVATAAVAVSTVGAVGAVESSRSERDPIRPAVVEDAGRAERSNGSSGLGAPVSDDRDAPRQGTSVDRGAGDDRSGPGGGTERERSAGSDLRPSSQEARDGDADGHGKASGRDDAAEDRVRADSSGPGPAGNDDEGRLSSGPGSGRTESSGERGSGDESSSRDSSGSSDSSGSGSSGPSGSSGSSGSGSSGPSGSSDSSGSGSSGLSGSSGSGHEDGGSGGHGSDGD